MVKDGDFYQLLPWRVLVAAVLFLVKIKVIIHTKLVYYTMSLSIKRL